MSLKTRIEEERDTVHELHRALKEVRTELWDAERVRKNDEQWEGESEEHWQERKKRNRHRRNKREDIVEHVKEKYDSHVKLLEQLKDKRFDYQEAKREKREARKEDGGFDKGSTSIVTFDGKSLVEDLAYWLYKARQNGWSGYLVSGYRTPEYSRQLCQNMCGADSCPGKCAGMASNHAKTAYPGPAADVSDYVNCERVLYAIGAPYSNDLPYDLVHMSRSGH